MFRFYLSVVLCLIITSVYAEPSRQIKDEIISRCRTTMGDHGSSIVKSCVEMEIKAYNELSSYSPEWSDFIEHCKESMASHGWDIVKACADMDIEAEEELRNM